MSGLAARMPRPARIGLPRFLRGFWTGMVAVVTKELRGRMRGRRAFAIVTVYLVLLSLFAWGIYELQRQSNEMRFQNGDIGAGAATISAQVGQSIFAGLLVLETLLILVLAPALTSGAVSQEREKQTLDLLIATPLSRLALVVGKLISALTYVLLLILASIPLSAIVFTFGGVGPEDILRAYVYLFAVAFGTGAIALFWSALLKRTQAATVISYLTVLALTLGATVLYIFWTAMNFTSQMGGFDNPQQMRERQPPEAILWLNPFVANVDLMCGTSISEYEATCQMISGVTGRIFEPQAVPAIERGGALTCDINGNCKEIDPGLGGIGVGVGEAPVDQGVAAPLLEPPRDTYWPRSALAFGGLGLLLTLLSSRLVSPGSLPRRRRNR
jgi:ABC-type transport system involved in multi-copper enzyme maturation permease subunit